MHFNMAVCLASGLSKSSAAERNRHAILVVNLPERPVFQHSVHPPTSNNHHDAAHRLSRDSRYLELTDDPFSYNSRPRVTRQFATDPSTRRESGIDTNSIDENNSSAIPQTLSHLRISEKDLKHVMKLGVSAYGEVT